MACKCCFNIFSIIHVSTVHQTAVETAKTAISAPQKRPSGEKHQKFIQTPCERKFATKDLNREFLSIRFFQQEFLVGFSVAGFSDSIDWFLAADFPPSDHHDQNLITGDENPPEPQPPTTNPRHNQKISSPVTASPTKSPPTTTI